MITSPFDDRIYAVLGDMDKAMRSKDAAQIAQAEAALEKVWNRCDHFCRWRIQTALGLQAINRLTDGMKPRSQVLAEHSKGIEDSFLWSKSA